MTTQQPKDVSDSPNMRRHARFVRNAQWQILHKATEHETLIWCWWDKAGRYRSGHPEHVYVSGLLTTMELMAWFRRHADWLEIGEWDNALYGAPVRITDAGRAALANRELYDMEPVEGGMVEPGWVCTPAPPATT